MHLSSEVRTPEQAPRCARLSTLSFDDVDAAQKSWQTLARRKVPLPVYPERDDVSDTGRVESAGPRAAASSAREHGPVHQTRAAWRHSAEPDLDPGTSVEAVGARRSGPYFYKSTSCSTGRIEPATAVALDPSADRDERLGAWPVISVEETCHNVACGDLVQPV